MPPHETQNLETNTKKMSYFSCCSNLVNLIFFIFLFIVFHTSLAEEEKPLFDLSSREDLVQAAGYGEEKLSTVLVTGSVLCEACLHGEPELRSWPIAGALVSVNCRTRENWSKPSSTKTVTDEYGDFLIDLPSHLHAIPNLDKACCVQVLRMPKNATCQPTYVRKHQALTLSSVGNGIRNYTSGKIKFLHLTSKTVHACTVQPKPSI